MTNKNIFLFPLLFLLIIGLGTYSFFNIRKIKNTSLDTINLFINSEEYKINKSNFKHEYINLILELEKNKKIDIDKEIVKKIYFENHKNNKLRINIFKNLIFNSLLEKPLKIDLFLNTAYFNNGIYGFYDASLYYFKKNINDISISEFEELLYLIVE